MAATQREVAGPQETPADVAFEGTRGREKQGRDRAWAEPGRDLCCQRVAGDSGSRRMCKDCVLYLESGNK